MIFLDVTPKSQTTKSKIDKCDYKLKSFFPAKESMNKIKRQPKEWEKIFANHIANRGPTPKTYKEFIQLKSKTIIIIKLKNR